MIMMTYILNIIIQQFWSLLFGPVAPSLSRPARITMDFFFLFLLILVLVAILLLLFIVPIRNDPRHLHNGIGASTGANNRFAEKRRATTINRGGACCRTEEHSDFHRGRSAPHNNNAIIRQVFRRFRQNIISRWLYNDVIIYYRA